MLEEEPMESRLRLIVAAYPPADQLTMTAGDDGASTLALWTHGEKGNRRKVVKAILEEARANLVKYRAEYEEFRNLRRVPVWIGNADDVAMASGMMLKRNHVLCALTLIHAAERELATAPFKENER